MHTEVCCLLSFDKKKACVDEIILTKKHIEEQMLLDMDKWGKFMPKARETIWMWMEKPSKSLTGIVILFYFFDFEV
jgi:hypothetical protein